MTELLPKKTLLAIKASGFPAPDVADAQIWYDNTFEKHGIVIARTFYFFGGGFSSIPAKRIDDRFLFQPSVTDFITALDCNFRIEKWDGLFSIKLSIDDNPVRLVSPTPLQAMAKAWLMSRKPQRKGIW